MNGEPGADSETPPAQRRIIKRYSNRKLYDTEHSRYVTLDQISEMIRAGDDVKIVDNKTKEDLTSITLAQIIFEEEKKQKSFLPLQAMRNIIQSGGESISHLVTSAQKKVTHILKRDDGDPAADPAGAAPEGSDSASSSSSSTSSKPASPRYTWAPVRICGCG